MMAGMEPRLSNLRPTPLNLPLFLPYASAQLQAPYTVRVLAQTQEEYVSKAETDKSKKGTRAKSTMSQHPASPAARTDSQERDDESGSPVHATYTESDDIVITAVHDSASRLVELIFNKCREVPRLLVQIIGLCMPYQRFLTKLTVRWVPLEGEALYEIAKFLPVSQLTDVCLDDSPVPERNYHSLLDHEQLRSVSLARCSLDDDDCAALAAKLAHPLPASRALSVLALVSNAIADRGACALAEALRSNRTLQHLNLAGNRVTDDGARALLRTLTEFPLTYAELTTKRRRFVEYLQRRKEVYLRCLGELTLAWHERPADDGARGARRRTAPSASRSRKSSTAGPSVGSGASGQDAVALRAETMANELLGSYSDPFGLEETASKEGYVYSLGNTSLCYLNLAHNRLCYASVSALRDTLRRQAALVRKAGSGLLRVVLEGNDLPAVCPEYAAIQELLERVILWKLSKPLKKTDKLKTKSKTG